MKAITIKQPWATLIASGVKGVENRTWPVPKTIRGQRIAIHAGKGFDDVGFEDFLEGVCGCDGEYPYCQICNLWKFVAGGERENWHEQNAIFEANIALSKTVSGRILATALVVGQTKPGEDFVSKGSEFWSSKPCFNCDGRGRLDARRIVGEMGIDQIFETLPDFYECEYCDGTGNGYVSEADLLFAEKDAYSWILADVRLTYDEALYVGKQGLWIVPEPSNDHQMTIKKDTK